MADQNSPAAAQPASAPAAPAAQPAPTQFAVPDGYELRPKSDIERMSRYEQQVRGFQPLYERLSKAGIKSEKDWDSYEPIVTTAQKRKLDAKAFAAMFSEEADNDLSGNQQRPQNIDIDGLKKQLLEQADERFYTLQNQEQRKNDGKVIDLAVSKLLGDGDHSPYEKAIAKSAVAQWMEENRPLYPDGHPLRTKSLAPLSEDMVEQVVGHFSKLKAQSQGAEMANVAKAAQAAAKPKVGTVAGGGTSPPGKPNTKDAGRRPGGLPSREAVEAAYQARQAARGG